MDVLYKFNKYAQENKSLIKKALTSATNVGEALVPEKLEQIITNTITRLSPEINMLDTDFDNQKYHEFNKLTALPSRGGAMGEAATTPTRNSTYSRTSIPLKVIRRKGAVTNFLQDASAKNVDAAAGEMETHLTAHIYDLIHYALYGNADANAYEHSGLDTYIETNRTQEGSETGTVPASLTFLDNMIDVNEEKNGAQHKRAFLMSPRMLSRISQLLTNVRLMQPISAGGLTEVDIEGGWRLMAYRGIPIIPSSACSPKAKMGITGTSTAGGGAAIADDTYYFRVSYMDYNGESEAYDEVNVVTVNRDTITLSWTQEQTALSYKIYGGTVSGATTLMAQISADTFTGDGTITTRAASYQFTATPAAQAEISTARQSDRPYTISGTRPESVFLWDLDKYQGLGKYAYTNVGGARFNGLVTLEPLAKTDDNLPFLVKTYGALIPSFEATSVIHRGLRPSA